jgi:N-acyl-D-amino-acid deacylase
MSKLKTVAIISLTFMLLSCVPVKPTEQFDVLILNGEVIDGSGGAPFKADVGIIGDKIVSIGKLSNATAEQTIDASGMVVTPGFINMLSWAVESLIEDGKSQSDIRQGVTLEVFGEGLSFGPLTDVSRQDLIDTQADIKYEITWNTLGEYLDFLVEKGVSTNVASFVGATTLRINTVGFEDRKATSDELNDMKSMVSLAMEEGAMGIGSSLIYAPAYYSSTEELIEICKVAAEYGGMYISHMRNESNHILESIDELIRIADEANIRAEIYHLKQAGQTNWDLFDDVVKKIETARADGLHITADMYNYTAGATGLDAAMPPWVQEGGYKQWAERLQDPGIRQKVVAEMQGPVGDWENLLKLAGTPNNVLLIGFKNKDLKHLTGKTLAEVADMRGISAEETAIELVIEDGSRVSTVYFLMSEENVKKQIALPWMSFGSDAESSAPEGVFLKSSTHPRAYGNFARLLGKYVRDGKVISLEEAVYKLTGMPASNLKIKNRGQIAIGHFADVLVFNPDDIQDHATFTDPLQYSTGMTHVFVNGVQVLKEGEHTGATPGQVVRGPGWIGQQE